ncbi:hypothetical protein ABZ543_08390 [Streptomyces roseifaciens]
MLNPDTLEQRTRQAMRDRDVEVALAITKMVVREADMVDRIVVGRVLADAVLLAILTRWAPPPPPPGEMFARELLEREEERVVAEVQRAMKLLGSAMAAPSPRKRAYAFRELVIHTNFLEKQGRAESPDGRNVR